jgi:hypothetical protein
MMIARWLLLTSSDIGEWTFRVVGRPLGTPTSVTLWHGVNEPQSGHAFCCFAS